MSFSKAGTVRKYVEPMPDDQEHLEELIVQRFVSALHQRHGRRIEVIDNLSKDERDPPDFLATEDGKKVGIEVTEVVDPLHRQLHSARQEYGRLVRGTLLKRGLQLRGIVVKIVDSNGEPSYPPTDSKRGEEMIASVVAPIEQRHACLAGLGLGAEQHTKLPNSVCPWAVFRRVAEDNTESELVQVEFQGGYMMSRDDTLITVIKSKIGKRYLLPSDTDLWLLTYGLLIPSDPESIRSAGRELSLTTHPFAEVWYAYPMPRDRGILLDQVWPREDFEP